MKVNSKGLTLLEILIAIIVVGIGSTVYLRVQHMSGGVNRTNSALFRAGQMVEKHIEAIRVQIAKDTNGLRWVPQNNFIESDSSGSPKLNLTRKVSTVTAPKPDAGGTYANIPSVRKIDIVVKWGTGAMDSLNVTTYVSKKF